MKIEKVFSKGLKSPYDDQKFEPRRSEIREPDGRVVFEKDNVMVPDSWSQMATDILAQKYFRRSGVPEKGGESDSRDVFNRMAGCWSFWGKKFGYFDSDASVKNFNDEIRYLLSHQMAAPNSPQWFNTGLHSAYGITGPAQGHYYVDPENGELKQSTSAFERPQPHACFIQKVEDNLVGEKGIMDLWVREARLFKYGSGTGSNFSNLRAAGEKLSGGGKSSGLLSFLKVGDKAAASVKSGGTTRRAAKMVCLDLDHPEIEDFILWKVREEEKVSALVAGAKLHRTHLAEIFKACGGKGGASIQKNLLLKETLLRAKAAGLPESFLGRAIQLASQGKTIDNFPNLDTSWEGEAYGTVSGQNANNTVRLNNEFFARLEKDQDWDLTNRSDGKVAKRVTAKSLWDKIIYAAWSSADPGLQFHTTINEWHTCPAGGEIRASNPCSEYMFLDDTACNLASINLLKFYDPKTKEFDIAKFRHACRLWTMVLEISVLMAQFPSQEIARNSYQYRTLGLGYANLGALLMSLGIPYGSPRSQAMTGALTAILTAESYSTSALMAKELGPFEKWKENRSAMLRVMRNHRRAAWGLSDYEGLSINPQGIDPMECPAALLEAARQGWDEALKLGEKHGYRNAQVSVVAPTGTIGLVMDCDTTGIEPDFALVKFKKLSGGGYFRIINGSVPRALSALGYLEKESKAIVNYCSGQGTLRGAPHLTPEALKAKGFDEAGLARVEAKLTQSFNIDYAFAPHSLASLGFTPEQIEQANEYVFGTLTVEGAPFLKKEHLPVFDCANRCGPKSTRSLAADQQLDMMAAAQPFLSGAISKTINLPHEATLDDVSHAYHRAWKMCLKAVAIYRDGSKLSQPLSFDLVSSRQETVSADKTAGKMEPPTMPRPIRRELPHRRFGYTVKATIGGQRIYLRTGEYEDGRIGEIFIDIYKEGAAYRSIMNALAISVSLGLQYGVPLEEYVNKFLHFRFEPNGFVADHDHIRFCSSIVDFIFRDLALNYLGRTDVVQIPPKASLKRRTGELEADPSQTVTISAPSDMGLSQKEWENDLAMDLKVAKASGYEGNACTDCGQFTLVRAGTCLRCLSCGSTSGCS